jgi:hypothetical protein
MANVYAIEENGEKTFYARANSNRELYQYTDDIESLGMAWDFDLI